MRFCWISSLPSVLCILLFGVQVSLTVHDACLKVHNGEERRLTRVMDESATVLLGAVSLLPGVTAALLAHQPPPGSCHTHTRTQKTQTRASIRTLSDEGTENNPRHCAIFSLVKAIQINVMYTSVALVHSHVIFALRSLELLQ